MEPLLLLVHRIPYPPNKGDKIRSYHLLKFLATRYGVHLGTFIDQEEDLAHLPVVAGHCASHFAVRLGARYARLRSVSGFLTGEALTLPYYRSAALRRWVKHAVVAHGIRKAVVFSGAMAQYVRDLPLHVVLDFVDVDSAKWTQYAERHMWPSSLVYKREGEKLLSFERSAAAGSSASVFVTRAEAELFVRLAPESAGRVHVIEMGVDTAFFAPDPERLSPYTDNEAAIVFTGAMDYWPNVDAAVWFTREVLPAIARQRPDVRFYVVGMNPVPTVSRLATDGKVVVTGRVADVRPFVQYAAVVVAPLRVARGIQSKVLEAMAMARPVVTTPSAARSIHGTPGIDFDAAAEAGEFASKVLALMGSAAGETMGRAARERIVADYNWERNLANFGELLKVAPPAAEMAG
jgi:sugar transferase (PEP-CTERM/EpsH1 system associated)